MKELKKHFEETHHVESTTVEEMDDIAVELVEVPSLESMWKAVVVGVVAVVLIGALAKTLAKNVAKTQKTLKRRHQIRLNTLRQNEEHLRNFTNQVQQHNNMNAQAAFQHQTMHASMASISVEDISLESGTEIKPFLLSSGLLSNPLLQEGSYGPDIVSQEVALKWMKHTIPSVLKGYADQLKVIVKEIKANPTDTWDGEINDVEDISTIQPMIGKIRSQVDSSVEMSADHLSSSLTQGMVPLEIAMFDLKGIIKEVITDLADVSESLNKEFKRDKDSEETAAMTHQIARVVDLTTNKIMVIDKLVSSLSKEFTELEITANKAIYTDLINYANRVKSEGGDSKFILATADVVRGGLSVLIKMR